MKGVFSVPVEVSMALAPSAVMLVYGLHPEGEMIADTTRFQIEKCFKNKVRKKEKESFFRLVQLIGKLKRI